VLRPIEELNHLPRDGFAEALRPLFESAPPLADALYADRPYASYPELIDAAERLALAMPFARQVEILAAHPRIGARPETLSPASRREQGHAAGMQAAKAEAVDAELAGLNAAYERAFGFRFVVFVNRRPKSAIVDVLRQRLQRTPDEELRTGLREMFRIARDRYSSPT
jgi:OHCU decarboxylase